MMTYRTPPCPNSTPSVFGNELYNLSAELKLLDDEIESVNAKIYRKLMSMANSCPNSDLTDFGHKGVFLNTPSPPYLLNDDDVSLPPLPTALQIPGSGFEQSWGFGQQCVDYSHQLFPETTSSYGVNPSFYPYSTTGFGSVETATGSNMLCEPWVSLFDDSAFNFNANAASCGVDMRGNVSNAAVSSEADLGFLEGDPFSADDFINLSGGDFEISDEVAQFNNNQLHSLMMSLLVMMACVNELLHKWNRCLFQLTSSSIFCIKFP